MTLRAKLSPKKQKAMEALLAEPTVAGAALAAGISQQALLRLMNNDREFGEAWRAAKRAAHRQCTRRLAQGFSGAVRSTVQIMYQGRTPAMRLKAAMDIRGLAKAAIEIDDFAAVVADAEHLVRMSRAAAGKRRKPGVGGHGAKYPRREEKAITALLTERTVAAAARVAGITTPTLNRWMEVPAFLARWAATAGAVFGEGMRLAQKHEDDAGIVIRNLSMERAMPDGVRLQANRYISREEKAQEMEDLDARMAESEGAAGSTGSGEPGETGKTPGRNFHQRLGRIKACLRASEPRRVDRILLIRAADGRPAGPTEVMEADGRRVPGEDQPVPLPEAS